MPSTAHPPYLVEDIRHLFTVATNASGPHDPEFGRALADAMTDHLAYAAYRRMPAESSTWDAFINDLFVDVGEDLIQYCFDRPQPEVEPTSHSLLRACWRTIGRRRRARLKARELQSEWLDSLAVEPSYADQWHELFAEAAEETDAAPRVTGVLVEVVGLGLNEVCKRRRSYGPLLLHTLWSTKSLLVLKRQWPKKEVRRWNRAAKALSDAVAGVCSRMLSERSESDPDYATIATLQKIATGRRQGSQAWTRLLECFRCLVS